ncbi:MULTISPECIES: transglutaminase family protein [Sphingobium]|uniref:Transglutaminase n=2 Tax=Sphingobium TaxID=165695 RepID=A0ABQ1FAJ3_SPHSA|nr:MULTISPECIES: transglutaminase family protein [Sphingobium]AJR24274.1 transglutaminase [Sphingobium sp. YBL2]RYL99809.1 transglutaminase family protein [Sphingobium fuliginis]WDA36358.1 transglutaminase family protein [Sphingobium sp. YC-XJ3]GGA03820.1 transglutaminase [Sphingobium fuliginis]
MIYRIRHQTIVHYDAPVQLARLNLRLRPAPWPGQWTSDYHLAVDPAPSSIESRPGAWPVHVARLEIDSPLRRISIDSSFRAGVQGGPAAEARDDDPTVGAVAEAALVARDMGPAGPAHYLHASQRVPLVAEIGAWAADLLVPERPIVGAALALAQRIKGEFAYVSGATDAATPVAEAFAARHGVCQDFAHVMVAALRWFGLPAAYVSGYLRTDPPPGMARLVGADAMHAWAMLWCGPARGWIGLDPTNGVIAGDGHLFVAMGRDYADVAPMDGLFVGGAGQSVQVMVDVMPEDEAA